MSHNFPAGLRVLYIGDDPTLEYMLHSCHYQVITCKRASDGFCFIQESSRKFDIGMIDISMTGINDGIRLLQKIVTHISSPVIVTSKTYKEETVMKVMMKGAIGYLVKPLKLEEVKLIWQHVVRHKNNSFKLTNELDDLKHTINSESSNNKNFNGDNEEEYQIDEVDDGGEIVSSSSFRKPRMVWTAELHEQFVDVVNQMGLQNAVPKKILELMNVPGLKRENVASHLQKYRLYVRRKSDHLDCKFNKMTSCNIDATFGGKEFQPIDSLEKKIVDDEVEGHVNITNTYQHIANERNSFPDYDYGSTQEPQVVGMPIDDGQFCGTNINIIASHPTTMLHLQQGVDDLRFLDESSQDIMLTNNGDNMHTYFPLTQEHHLSFWDQIQSHDDTTWT